MIDMDPFNVACDMRFRFWQEFRVKEPPGASQMTMVPKLESTMRVTMLRDPAKRWASSWSEFGRQLLDILRYEFWVGAGQSWRSPGARSAIVRKIDVGAGGPSRAPWAS